MTRATRQPGQPLTIETIIASTRIIPVLSIDRLEDAVPLAEALLAGGLPVLEVTLRTEAALPAIEAIARSVPEMTVGAGTILTPQDLREARRAGARFGVSPGLTLPLAERLEDGWPFLPGAVTPTEIMAARDFGFRTVKFFPAEVYGGPAAITALGGPFRDMRFCPTGGVREANLRAFLDLPNVPCVGGSWMASRADLAARDWRAITTKARRSVEIASGTVTT